jgi:DNA-binding transcriptional LysR family regulator
MLDPRRLEVLRAVAQHGSFSAAADALSFTQPAVSKQIAALERQAGTALLERTPRGVRLTQAGSVLVDHAAAIAERLSAAEAQLDALASLEGGRLRMAAFPTAVATVVSEAVAAFGEAHPSVRLSLEERVSEESLDLLRSGDVDLALVATYGEPDPDLLEGIELHHLIDDPMFVALPRGHALAKHARVPARSLAREAWVEGRRPDCTRALDQLGAAAGFQPRVAFETVDWIGKQGLVAAGVGVALVPALGLAMLREDIVVRRLKPDAPGRRVHAAVSANGYTAPAVPAMLEVLAEQCAAQQARVESLSESGR